MRWFRVLCDRLDDVIRDLIWKSDWCERHLYDSKLHTWIDRHSESTAICRDCCAMTMDRPDSDIWYPLFVRICLQLGFTRKGADVLWSNLDDCNWEHLHLTEGERKYTPDQWHDQFVYDIHYCSDRWSLSRILRVQWAFIQWQEALDREDH